MFIYLNGTILMLSMGLFCLEKVIDINLLRLQFTIINVPIPSFQFTNDINSDIFAVFVAISFFCVTPYLLCYFATKITINAESVSLCIWNSNWYKYPVKYQIYCKLILMRAQRPVYFHGFKMITAEMETLLKVKDDSFLPTYTCYSFCLISILDNEHSRFFFSDVSSNINNMPL